MTAKQLAGYQRRSLRVMRERVLRLSSDWDGLDQYNLSELEKLADQIETVAVGLSDAGSDDMEA